MFFTIKHGIVHFVGLVTLTGGLLAFVVCLVAPTTCFLALVVRLLALKQICLQVVTFRLHVCSPSNLQHNKKRPDISQASEEVPLYNDN